MKLTGGQHTVLQAFKNFGDMDDVALTVYVHHIADNPMSSSGVRSRRAELVRKGCITTTGKKRLKSGREASIHGITATGRQALRAASRRKAAVAA